MAPAVSGTVEEVVAAEGGVVVAGPPHASTCHWKGPGSRSRRAPRPGSRGHFGRGSPGTSRMGPSWTAWPPRLRRSTRRWQRRGQVGGWHRYRQGEQHPSSSAFPPAHAALRMGPAISRRSGAATRRARSGPAASGPPPTRPRQSGAGDGGLQSRRTGGAGARRGIRSPGGRGGPRHPGGSSPPDRERVPVGGGRAGSRLKGSSGCAGARAHGRITTHLLLQGSPILRPGCGRG